MAMFRRSNLLAASISSSGGLLFQHRLRTTPNIAKSMDAFDLSAKNKSPYHPRRISNLTKHINTPRSITPGNLTPISENQRNRLNTPANSDSPMSDASKSSHRRKFSVLSSASYWLGQIKLSESASKHSILLGFFNLALQSGAEPVGRIREELKLYVLKHNLLEELGNTTKDVLNSYNIVEDLEKSQALERHSQLAEDVTQNLDEVAKNSAVLTRARNLKPKFLKMNTPVESNKEKTVQKGTQAITRASNSRNQENAIPMNENAIDRALETSQRPTKQQMSKGRGKIKCSEKNSGSDQADGEHNEEPKPEDKENMITKNMDIYSSIEALCVK